MADRAEPRLADVFRSFYRLRKRRCKVTPGLARPLQFCVVEGHHARQCHPVEEHLVDHRRLHGQHKEMHQRERQRVPLTAPHGDERCRAYLEGAGIQTLLLRHLSLLLQLVGHDPDGHVVRRAHPVVQDLELTRRSLLVNGRAKDQAVAVQDLFVDEREVAPSTASAGLSATAASDARRQRSGGVRPRANRALRAAMTGNSAPPAPTAPRCPT